MDTTALHLYHINLWDPFFNLYSHFIGYTKVILSFASLRRISDIYPFISLSEFWDFFVWDCFFDISRLSIVMQASPTIVSMHLGEMKLYYLN